MGLVSRVRRAAEALALTRSERLAALLLVGVVLTGVVWREVCEPNLRRGELTVVRSPRAARVLIDLNSAQWCDLVVLPGIGPVLARRIVAERNNLPGQRFKRLDQLLDVHGIGPKKLERIRPFVRLERGSEDRRSPHSQRYPREGEAPGEPDLSARD